MWELLADLVNILLGVLGLFQSKSSGAVCPYCEQNVRDDATACPRRRDGLPALRQAVRVGMAL